MTASSAPLVYLHSKDIYKPTDVATFLQHVSPRLKFDPITTSVQNLTLDALSNLNASGGKEVNLTSNDDVTKDPAWILGASPDANGRCDGIQTAIIVVDKGDGVEDVFYMYFYGYNWGGVVNGNNLGKCR